jgi:hypothetical protein
MMKPKIDGTKFGSIIIEGEKYKYDVIIRTDGQIKKRKKKLSKEIYGTSHKLSLQEARHVYEAGAEELIFGTGMYGRAELAEDTIEFFKQKGCQVQLFPTPEAIKAWNKAQGAVIGLFHVSC